jgi:hypothetical protein
VTLVIEEARSQIVVESVEQDSSPSIFVVEDVSEVVVADDEFLPIIEIPGLGPQGIQGETGLKGDQGDQGFQGHNDYQNVFIQNTQPGAIQVGHPDPYLWLQTGLPGAGITLWLEDRT